jgi:hypothetical protein
MDKLRSISIDHIEGTAEIVWVNGKKATVGEMTLVNAIVIGWDDKPEEVTRIVVGSLASDISSGHIISAIEIIEEESGNG